MALALKWLTNAAIGGDWRHGRCRRVCRRGLRDRRADARSFRPHRLLRALGDQPADHGGAPHRSDQRLGRHRAPGASRLRRPAGRPASRSCGRSRTGSTPSWPCSAWASRSSSPASCSRWSTRCCCCCRSSPSRRSTPAGGPRRSMDRAREETARDTRLAHAPLPPGHERRAGQGAARLPASERDPAPAPRAVGADHATPLAGPGRGDCSCGPPGSWSSPAGYVAGVLIVVNDAIARPSQRRRRGPGHHPGRAGQPAGLGRRLAAARPAADRPRLHALRVAREVRDRARAAARPTSRLPPRLNDGHPLRERRLQLSGHGPVGAVAASTSPCRPAPRSRSSARTAPARAPS